MKYDDASWHYGGEFPKGLPIENGGVHIALFMKWAFINGWVGELHLSEELEDTERVISGELSATEFFFKYCDGKLTNEDFNEEGNMIASRYFGEEGLYLDDYSNAIEHELYHGSEEEHDFESLRRKMDSRLSSGILTQTEMKSSRPWWKIW